MNSNRRQRGHSFHEDYDDNGPIDIHNIPRNNQHYVRENNIEFITPPYEGPETLDLSHVEDDYVEDEDEEDSDQTEDEDEIYNRGRSRSKSIFKDTDVIQGIDPVLVQMKELQIDANPITPDKSIEKHERKGPLHTREVQALKKGLEQATPSRNKEELEEEELEKRDAENERLIRVSHTYNSPSDQTIRRVKLLLLGDSNVGKSSLVMRWTMDTFSPTLISTVGVNFKTKRVVVHGEPVQVQVWDTAGQEQFHRITTSYYRGANAIIVVYDVSDKKSLSNVEYWIKNIKTHASDSVQVVLVGNKSDLRLNNTNTEHSNYCTYEIGYDMSQRFGIPFYETSAKDSYNVDEAFMKSVDIFISNELKSYSLFLNTKKKLIDKSDKQTKQSGIFRILRKDKKSITSTTTTDPINNNINNNNTNTNTNVQNDKEKCVIS